MLDFLLTFAPEVFNDSSDTDADADADADAHFEANVCLKFDLQRENNGMID